MILGLFEEPIALSGQVEGLEPRLVELIIELRNRARQLKNFELADYARKSLADIGVLLEDRPEGTTWRKK